MAYSKWIVIVSGTVSISHDHGRGSARGNGVTMWTIQVDNGPVKSIVDLITISEDIEID